MGLTAGVSSSSAGVSSSAAGAASSATSLLSPVGVGVGGIFVATSLILLLAYYDVIGASEKDYGEVRTMVAAAIAPLLMTFAGVVAFESFSLLGYI